MKPRQAVNRLWQKVDQDFGRAGQPLPDVRFVKRGPLRDSFGSVVKRAAAITDEPTPGSRVTYYGQGLTKQLKQDPRSALRRGGTRYELLWELARQHQPSDSFAVGNTPEGVGYPRHMTNTISRRLNKDQAQRLKAKRSKNPRVSDNRQQALSRVLKARQSR